MNAKPPASPPGRHAGLSLRLKINLIVGGLSLAFVLGLGALQFNALREGVREETVAANRVAAQLLERLAQVEAMRGAPGLLAFLQGLGRVRSNDLALFDAQGTLLYRSPESAYKAGRDAPAWFQRLIAPPAAQRVLQFDDARLELRANASRSVLDAWDSLRDLAAGGAALLLALNLLVAWMVGRTAQPFGRIVQGLSALEAGRFDARLPALPGREAGAIAAAFNRMATRLDEHIATERRAVRAEAQLNDQRELAQWLNRHIEQERRAIARELHDELGQTVTGVRSLALSIAQRNDGHDATSAQAARLIAAEAARLYDAMHGLIPRLAPLVLDALGLEAALHDLAERSRRHHPEVTLELQIDLGGMEPGAEVALALYRSAQEGITNALRHGRATRLRLVLEGRAERDGSLRPRISLQLDDNGQGLPPAAAEAWAPAGPSARRHHGLRWLHERCAALGGELTLTPRQPPPGLRLQVSLPAAGAGTGPHAGAPSIDTGAQPAAPAPAQAQAQAMP